MTPNASRRTSILYASADEVMPVVKAQKDDISGDGLAKEQQKAVARQKLVFPFSSVFLSRTPCPFCPLSPLTRQLL